jgi:hypothetical protein
MRMAAMCEYAAGLRAALQAVISSEIVQGKIAARRIRKQNTLALYIAEQIKLYRFLMPYSTCDPAAL